MLYCIVLVYTQHPASLLTDTMLTYSSSQTSCFNLLNNSILLYCIVFYFDVSDGESEIARGLLAPNSVADSSKPEVTKCATIDCHQYHPRGNFLTVSSISYPFPFLGGHSG